jgi:hypothetical protein
MTGCCGAEHGLISVDEAIELLLISSIASSTLINPCSAPQPVITHSLPDVVDHGKHQKYALRQVK